MHEKFDIPALVTAIIAILITVGIGMGVYDISTGLVADGQFFDASLESILNSILQSINQKLAI